MLLAAAIAISSVQPLNAYSSTVALSGMLMEVKEVQWWNAQKSILLTESGMTTRDLSDLQYWKVNCRIDNKELGRTTFAKDEQ